MTKCTLIEKEQGEMGVNYQIKLVNPKKMKSNF